MELDFTEALSVLIKDTSRGPDQIKYSDTKNLSENDKSEPFTLHEKNFAKK